MVVVLSSGGGKVVNSIEFVDLGDPASVTAAFELAGHKSIEGVESGLLPNESFADAHHVGIVVGPTQAGGRDIVHRGRTHTGDLASGHGDTNATATHAHTEVGIRGSHGSSDGGSKVGVVHTLGAMGAKIYDLVAGSQEARRHGVLELESGMVGPNGDNCHLICSLWNGS
jgi:hypothetical protein